MIWIKKKNSNPPDKNLSTDTKVDPIERQKGEEEMVVSKSLGGQTISKASIDLDSNGAKLNLELVNSLSPASFEWNNDGSIVFSFKDRDYTIRRGK